MRLFIKNKIKILLIDDFVKISLISNFYYSLNIFKTETIKNFNLNDKLVLDLKNKYIKIIKKLNLNDQSFDLLLTELNLNNKLFEREYNENFKNLNRTLNETKKVLTEIANSLDYKLKLFNITI